MPGIDDGQFRETRLMIEDEDEDEEMTNDLELEGNGRDVLSVPLITINTCNTESGELASPHQTRRFDSGKWPTS